MSAMNTLEAAPPLIGLTPEEFLEQYGKDDFVELIRGEVTQLTPATYLHGYLENWLGRMLGEFVDTNKLGQVTNSSASFILEAEPYTVRSPDVAFVSIARLPKDWRKGFFPGAPDFAVEILSPTDSLKATEAKARMFLRAGSLVVWIVNPQDFTARVYRPDQEPVLLSAEDEIDAEPALPGFRCPVRDLFGDLTDNS